MREAFILLHSKAYKEEAQRVYNRLLQDIREFTNKELFDDFQKYCNGGRSRDHSNTV